MNKFFIGFTLAAMVFLFIGAISLSIEKIITLGAISISAAILAVATRN